MQKIKEIKDSLLIARSAGYGESGHQGNCCYDDDAHHEVPVKQVYGE